MAICQTMLHCPTCGEPTLHQKSVFGAGWGLAWTVITGGLFLPIWLLLAIVDSAKPYHCLACSEPTRRGGADTRGTRHEPGSAGRTAHRRHAERHSSRRPGPFPRTRRSCPECRASLPLNARYCRDCGAPLSE